MQKSHQGRSSFQLREDQVQDLISCRLALFQPGEKDLIEEGGRAQLFWRLGKEGCKAKELVHAGISGGDPTVGGCLPTLAILRLPSSRVVCLHSLQQDFLQCSRLCWSLDFARLVAKLIFPPQYAIATQAMIHFSLARTYHLQLLLTFDLMSSVLCTVHITYLLVFYLKQCAMLNVQCAMCDAQRAVFNDVGSVQCSTCSVDWCGGVQCAAMLVSVAESSSAGRCLMSSQWGTTDHHHVLIIILIIVSLVTVILIIIFLIIVILGIVSLIFIILIIVYLNNSYWEFGIVGGLISPLNFDVPKMMGSWYSNFGSCRPPHLRHSGCVCVCCKGLASLTWQ